MAGYSGTPLAKKLGIEEGHIVSLVKAPDGFSIDVPAGVDVRTSLRGTVPLDVILLFCADERTMVKGFGPAAKRLATAGGLWVCWPKKSSGVPTDLHDAVVREFGLSTGLVDNKVCAVDDTWSGLRFVRRLADR